LWFSIFEYSLYFLGGLGEGCVGFGSFLDDCSGGGSGIGGRGGGGLITQKGYHIIFNIK